MESTNTITTKAYPRAALIGNPSDGYHGKTIAFCFENFHAEIKLSEFDKIEIRRPTYDVPRYRDLDDFQNRIEREGYYGGERLIKASIITFLSYCRTNKEKIHNRNFKIEYNSSIPKRLGLGGSSAIVTATFRALKEFYNIDIKKEILPGLIMAAETKELGISAGLQDRVAQVYERPVYMDFDSSLFLRKSYGKYVDFPKEWLPNLYIAYREENAEGSESTHDLLYERYYAGDEQARRAVGQLVDLTDKMFDALKKQSLETIDQIINANFDIRKTIIDISDANLELIDAARRCGASAKFTGSGGAILGLYRDKETYARLERAMEDIGAKILIPEIVDRGDH